MSRVIRLGTRTTPLALWQAERVAERLRSASAASEVRLVPFVTEGDRRLSQSLPEIGGKGVFTAELEAALRDHSIDIAVHSLKDLPVEQPEGLMLGAILDRADVRDAWFSRTGDLLDDLPEGSLVGTSSLRRRAQLQARRPDLRFESIRGSVGTRLEKVRSGQYDATVLALAGLQRLGLEGSVTSVFDTTVMLPAPGQAALAVQCSTDSGVASVLETIDDAAARSSTTAERTFLEWLGGGCSTPIGAYARPAATGGFELDAGVFAVDGSARVAVHSTGAEAERLGRDAAQQAIASGALRLLVTDGGDGHA